MKCVECENELEERDHEGVTVQACPDGCGVWVDVGELEEIVQDETLARSDDERAHELSVADTAVAEVVGAYANEGRRSCPRCGDDMAKYEFAGSSIVLDRCGGHGTWLDHGELERVEAFAEGFRRSLARIAV